MYYMYLCSTAVKQPSSVDLLCSPTEFFTDSYQTNQTIVLLFSARIAPFKPRTISSLLYGAGGMHSCMLHTAFS